MFQFKQFTIHQDRTAMKVGTDGVLLGAWAPILSSTQRLLDIGTGTGLIALMLAQRMLKENNNSTFKIDAIDIDQSSIEQATENINNSPFARFITTHFTSLQDYSPSEKYDAIVCNPPISSHHSNVQTQIAHKLDTPTPYHLMTYYNTLLAYSTAKEHYQ